MLADYEMAQVDGLQIHHRRSLQPGAPKLLLTGAWPQSIHCWEACWPGLAEHFDLLAVDLPGFGRSEGRPELMCPSAQGAFLGLMLEHFGFVGAHAVMPDVGVPVGLWALANRPTLLSGATFANGPGVHPPALGGGLDLALSSRLTRRTVSAAPDAFVTMALYRGYRRFTPSAALRATYLDCYRGGRLRHTLEFLASYPAELAAIDRGLGQIEQQVHLVWGRRDPFLLEDNAHRLARRLKHCTLELLDDAGHFSHEDAPEALLASLVGPRFARGLSDSAQPRAGSGR